MIFNGVKVFSATMYPDRERLGERIERWLSSMRGPGFEIVDIVQSQSSDDAFHMIAIIVFFNEPLYKRKAKP